MEDRFNQTNCSDDDVVAFIPSEMCKFGKLEKALQYVLRNSLADNLVEGLKTEGINGTTIYDFSGRGRAQIQNSRWFIDGKNCEILNVGARGWQKGKLRIKVTLEFCPDEPEVKQELQSNELESNQPESPLDDIRRMMNQDN